MGAMLTNKRHYTRDRQPLIDIRNAFMYWPSTEAAALAGSPRMECATSSLNSGGGVGDVIMRRGNVTGVGLADEGIQLVKRQSQLGSHGSDGKEFRRSRPALLDAAHGLYGDTRAAGNSLSRAPGSTASLPEAGG